MLAPVIPYLTDSVPHLDGLLESIAAAGAAGVTVLPMHLRGSTRGWFLNWLAAEHPALIRRYRQLYGRGASVAPEYTRWLAQRVDPLVQRHRLGGPRNHRTPTPRARDVPARTVPAPTLF